MHENAKEKKSFTLSTGILVMVCVTVIILVFACGIAYSGIQQARITAAKASVGQIQSAFILAESKAVESGLTPPGGSYQNVLKSYDAAAALSLTPYEKFVLDAMMDQFGTQRDFDFSITRYKDGTGNHVYTHYFPYIGKTNIKKDLYYVAIDGAFSEHNG